jgi:uracil-DNA glycosylase
MFQMLHPDWQALLEDQKELLLEIEQRFDADPKSIPAKPNLLRAFSFPPSHFRVLIVGQDPYPNPEHATGLAFAVPEGTRPLPPTLTNIFKELRSDLGVGVVQTGNIEPWLERGVMLLNRHLSTQSDNSAAHLGFGWAEFTDAAIKALNKANRDQLVAILWGKQAQELSPLLTRARIISSSHPSPLASYRGFLGSKPFSRCNQLLVELGLEPIDWSA